MEEGELVGREADNTLEGSARHCGRGRVTGGRKGVSGEGRQRILWRDQ